MPVYALGDRRPQLPAEGKYFIAPSADVIGDVRLSEGASVWFNCTLRGDNDPIILRENANVQDNTVAHTDAGTPVDVGRGVTVGHSVVLHSTVIGENTLIGMGSTLLSHSRIGRNCIIGAGALVREGQEIPDNSLAVGMPAKVVRTLDEKVFEAIRQSCLTYVRNAERFLEQLREL